MGFVKYTISPKLTIADGAVINNFADIYFDMNVPVRTGTTLNTIDYNLGIEPLFGENKVHIYPNPTSESITVELTQPCETCRIEISNTLGQKIMVDAINQNSEILNLKSFPKGIYFISVISNNETLSVQKLIVQ